MGIIQRKSLAVLFAVVLSFSGGAVAWGHCDGEDGPVITEARSAIDAGDVTPVLKWVEAKDESTIRELFDMTQAVRGESDAAKKVADQHFVETLVRIHRASEGAAFTGIMPAGAAAGSAEAKADAALEAGEIDALADTVAGVVRDGIKERFAETQKAAAAKDSSVEAGREFVHKYVDYVHYVKGVHDAATSEGHHNHGTSDAGHDH